ncbi:UNKNOWN [Stylonychia lemnae]|uniref:Uncharacterized protein n=1 Tax=Stylonychia lemnae TaxID=5949 RepID=A0A078BB55_STYLE|nr:UNKNOWN [Stylonychia lemnae]|eukprot:CDW90487.1 UNKNOWN [Stylonychia lemnae]
MKGKLDSNDTEANIIRNILKIARTSQPNELNPNSVKKNSFSYFQSKYGLQSNQESASTENLPIEDSDVQKSLELIISVFMMKKFKNIKQTFIQFSTDINKLVYKDNELIKILQQQLQNKQIQLNQFQLKMMKAIEVIMIEITLLQESLNEIKYQSSQGILYKTKQPNESTIFESKDMIMYYRELLFRFTNYDIINQVELNDRYSFINDQFHLFKLTNLFKSFNTKNTIYNQYRSNPRLHPLSYERWEGSQFKIKNGISSNVEDIVALELLPDCTLVNFEKVTQINYILRNNMNRINENSKLQIVQSEFQDEQLNLSNQQQV